LYKDTAERIKRNVADYELRSTADYLRGIAHGPRVGSVRYKVLLLVAIPSRV